MKIIFMGTASFSKTVLEALHAAYEVVLVMTQPDKALGRKQIMTPTDVANYAVEQNLPVLKPHKLSEAAAEITKFECDFLVTASFGQYVPTKLLQHPKIKAINVHASLLPKYRGASPVHQAIRNNDKETGITYMEMVKEMDAGDYYHQERLPIQSSWTTEDLMKELASLAAQTLPSFLQHFHQYSPVKQDPTQVSFAPKLKKSDGYLDFNQSAVMLVQQIKAFALEPGCRFELDGKEIKVFKAEVLDHTGPTAEVLSVSMEGIEIACREGSLLIQELQVPGKTRQSASEFIKGNPWVKPGMKGATIHG